MWLIDQLVEQQIRAAQEKGELSNLPGEGCESHPETANQVSLIYLNNHQKSDSPLKAKIQNVNRIGDSIVS